MYPIGANSNITMIEGRVAGKRQWTRNLFSLLVDASDVTFVAGQFGRLALPAVDGQQGLMVGRPYSFVNPPHCQPHEFHFVVLPDGPLSPRLAMLNVGDKVWLSPRAFGFFSVNEVSSADVLWCFSTGTGVSPFLSMLRTDEPWSKFSLVVLVHAVRTADELTYREEINEIGKAHAGAFTFVPFVSREPHTNALGGAYHQP